jgi:hypothetical protein
VGNDPRPGAAKAPAAPAVPARTPARAPAAPAKAAAVLPPVSAGTASWLLEDPEHRPAGAARPVQPVAMQRAAPPADRSRPPTDAGLDENLEYNIRLTPPGVDTLFRRESETQLMERMRQEALSRRTPERVKFPDEDPYLTKEPYKDRAFPPMNEVVEPYYVCYKRLGFEQKNFERQGWDLGFITPFVSAAAFYKDVFLLPYHVGTEPCRRYECNSGYCLPGTPTPLLLYPPEFSLTGTFLEAGTIVGIIFAFPG